MTGNREFSSIYKDPVNDELCNSFKDFLNKNFTKVRMFSKVDYRKKNLLIIIFLFLNKKFKKNSKSNKKKLAINSIETEKVFKRKGFFFHSRAITEIF